jgi:hypothetical protein
VARQVRLQDWIILDSCQRTVLVAVR